MTTTLTVLALLVAATAAARSTWSPCGLSMLSTITPVGERARGHRYGATCAWFVVGATAGGLALGALSAGLAALVGVAGASAVRVGVVALVATLVAMVSDTGMAGARVPVHSRQVNERWLDAYRPWVYGAGFGFQIGCGLATFITTTAVYLTVVLAALTASPVAALAVGTAFGVVRGLAVTLTRHVRTPEALLAFHQRFAALRPWADRAVLASMVVSAVVLAAALGPVPVAAVLLVVACATVVVRQVAQAPSVAPAVSVDAMTDTTSSTPSPSAPAARTTASAPSPASSAAGSGSGRLSRQRR